MAAASPVQLVEAVIEEVACAPPTGIPAVALFSQLAARGLVAPHDPAVSAGVLRLLVTERRADVIVRLPATYPDSGGSAPVDVAGLLQHAVVLPTPALQRRSLGLTGEQAAALKPSHLAVLSAVARWCACGAVIKAVYDQPPPPSLARTFPRRLSRLAAAPRARRCPRCAPRPACT
jgi:hypothetical protein